MSSSISLSAGHPVLFRSSMTNFLSLPLLPLTTDRGPRCFSAGSRALERKKANLACSNPPSSPAACLCSVSPAQARSKTPALSDDRESRVIEGATTA